MIGGCETFRPQTTSFWTVGCARVSERKNEVDDNKEEQASKYTNYFFSSTKCTVTESRQKKINKATHIISHEAIERVLDFRLDALCFAHSRSNAGMFKHILRTLGKKNKIKTNQLLTKER